MLLNGTDQDCLRPQFVQGYTPKSLYSFSYACITELVKLLITKCKLNVNIKEGDERGFA